MDKPEIWMEISEYVQKKGITEEAAKVIAIAVKERDGKTYVKVPLETDKEKSYQQTAEHKPGQAVYTKREKTPAAPAKRQAPTQPIPIKWPKEINVKVTNVDISFWQLVNLMVKAAFAAIPAIIIITIISWGVTAILGLF